MTVSHDFRPNLSLSRPRLRPLRILWAYIKRDWRLAISYRFPFVMRFGESILQITTLFFVSKIVNVGHNPMLRHQLYGGYYGFVLVGSGLLTVVSSALGSFATKLRTEQTTGTLEAVLMSPTPVWMTVLASAAYPLLYAFVGELVTIALATLFFGLHLHTGLTSLGLVAISAIASLGLFSSIGVLVAAYVVVFKRGTGPVRVIVTVFSLFGGVIYPVSVLPSALRVIGELLPFTWAVNTIRGGLLTDSVPISQLTALILSSIILVPATLWVFSMAVNNARRAGTLGQF